jgi:hypothetical protein
MKKADLEKILAILHRLDIPFVLVGGHAVAAWGAVRATRDIDLLASVPEAQGSRLTKELKQAGFKVDHRKGDESDPLRGLIRVERADAPDALPVEIILGLRKMPDALFMRARKLSFLGLDLPVASPEDMILLKLMAGGPVDMEDACSIFFVMKGKLDMKYLEAEARRMRISLKKVCYAS